MTKSELIHKIESCFPKTLVEKYRFIKRFFRWLIQYFYHKIAEKRVRRKYGPLNVVFIVQNASIWKYDSLYRTMIEDKHFNPVVFLVPFVASGDDFMQSVYESTRKDFLSRGYNLVCSINKDGSLVNVADLQPDVIFYAYQYSYCLPDIYRPQNLKRYLKCYVNYAFASVPDDWAVASPFHGLMWRCFLECESNREQAVSYQPREMKNSVVTGYPIYDEFANVIARGDDWKIKDNHIKRVIWAPHHTIEGRTGMLQFSTFLKYSETMLKMAEKYRENIQFVFRPHPMLKPALYDHSQWGKEKTDAYYHIWESMENTAYVTRGYVDLLKSSDAMIHDCGSFIIEYQYVNKPALYLATYDRLAQSNEVGRAAYKCHYLGYSDDDIDSFLKDVVLDGKDTKSIARELFVKEYILPPNGRLAAENIVEYLVSALCK